MSDAYKIVKVGGGKTAPPPPLQKRKKSMKTFPKGVLKKTSKAKIQAVRDPAKAPPFLRKSTLRILTEKGAEKRRSNIKHTVRNMSDHKVKETLQKAGMNVSNKLPLPIARDILASGMEAGMIVAK